MSRCEEPPQRIRLAFVAAEQEGLAFAHKARVAAIIAVALWLLMMVPFPRVTWYLGGLALFYLFGAIPHALRTRPDAFLWKAGFALLDVALLTTMLLLPNPFAGEGWPVQMKLRFPDFLYYFVYLSGTALSGSVLLVVWVGGASALAWSTGMLLILGLPDTITDVEAARLTGAGQDADNWLALFLSPTFVNLVVWYNQVALLLIVTGLLAAGAWRARRHLERLVEAEVDRTLLTRYFSPGVAERLALEPGEPGPVRRVDAAVLFVDLVGFTRYAAVRDATEVMEFLRAFHERMAACVFQHEGCLDKYLGDGLMASFGAVTGTGRDASNALACACSMAAAIEDWNHDRVRGGLPPVRVGIGVHWGPVVVGTLGHGRRLEYTVVGDVVNVASRLERLTRTHGVTALASADLIEAARRDGRDPLAAWSVVGDVNVPEHGGVIGVWAVHPAGDDRGMRVA
ncbi:adenylate/guanylate cyclase domain-containing protein [Azospirillum sp. RWY-5-1]|uniref:Adenylate/guanylate cyclase domain-containing protein n=1 Tax=Azospirillum oleiclasticum TaxID=2735135 RepID=A0ABX2TD48_9PROT|nr:adenylate/guanylate cyclase domain-containing protein [Azospirillum oleiclasticum]NYZ13796.1 adenylate/guanylate cyclase domain-containing protein [Azospirillum oleiclasticum]NYZ21068.1 adenylate/guanylate cyclase domain-containing protein [Azospirillum oleiclasticum]